MLFWLTLAAIAVLTGLWMARPFLQARSVEMSGSDAAISVYRDQIDELERDLKTGQIGARECETARIEIERRALAAARQLDRGFLTSKRSLAAATGLTLIAGIAAIGSYAWLGAPERPDQPLAARKTQELTRRADAGDLTSGIQLLIERTRETPEDFETWWMLARSYAAIGDHASAADAYRNAAELGGDRPAVLSAYAESMTLANGNKVPAAARVIFEQLANETADPRARYYVALARAQAQDFEGALQSWTELARESAPDAPWMPLVRRDIVNMARFLDVDVTTYLPDVTEAEIAAAGAGETDAGAKIAELETALAAEPKDYKRWISLARARATSGDQTGAVAALAEGRRHYAAAPFVLERLADAERSLGLDLVASEPRGPDAEDIAAASEMTQTERDDMIAGMVAGLAARLEEQPNDPQGWIMLVRSYSTMGEPAKAKAAFEKASVVFSGDEQTLESIREQTVGLVTEN